LDHKSAVRVVYEEGFSKGRFEVLHEHLHEDYVNHNPVPGAQPGLPGLEGAMAGLRGAFPDLTYTIEDLVAEGEKVAVRATMEGTHLGTFRGVEPTGRHFAVTSLAIVRFEGGKVAERWGLHDVELMSAQLEGRAG
jgi:predicted ester cyclase